MGRPRLRRGALAVLLLLCAAAPAACVRPPGGTGAAAVPDGPIAGIAWDARTPLPAVTYDSGPDVGGRWWRLVKSSQSLEVGSGSAAAPSLTVAMNGSGAKFAWDGDAEAFRLEKQGALGQGFTRFFGLTPGNRRQEPYAIAAFTDESGEEALYGLLGRGELATLSGVQHFNGGYLLSRRDGDRPGAAFAGKAQLRLDGSARPPGLALLLTAPAELPRLFGRGVGAIQLTAPYDSASRSFRAEGEIDGVGAGADGRLRLGRYALFVQIMNRGGSAVGLFRLTDRQGAPLAVGAFGLQSTVSGGPQTSAR